ncbi:MAG: RidA family protein [Clostridia bacterium]|nr:RidA family protein [Clostridia bacterium]
MKKVLHSDQAPAAIGPYSQGILAGNTVYVSGQLPIVPATGELLEGSIADQTAQALRNISAILAEAGFEMKDVVKTTVLLRDIKDFAEMNAAYGLFFAENAPARACFQVACLPKNASLEIECIAVRD